jgi:diaminopimelate decarboxylase
MIDWAMARVLAQQYGTPLYVYDLDQVDLRIAELRSILPCGHALYYSLKANPLPALAGAARAAGCRAEVASCGELAAALDAGFHPSEILYTGPAKTESELRTAAREGVGCFSAESLRDLERIAAASWQGSAKARVIVRINPTEAPASSLAMTGIPSQFGFDETVLRESMARISDRVVIIGIHVYLGTQAADAGALAKMFRIAIDTAERCADFLNIQVIDLGGGFPWPFATNGTRPDLTPLTHALRSIADSRVRTANAELWFESGRYVSASSGALISRVMDVKESRGATYYVLDAGISSLGGMSGLGRVLHPAISLIALDPPATEAYVRADVVGPLCTPLDCLARGVQAPEMEPGGLLAIPNVGAYGATASLSGFLSRPAAVEVWMRSGRPAGAARLRGGHEILYSKYEVQREGID